MRELVSGESLAAVRSVKLAEFQKQCEDMWKKYHVEKYTAILEKSRRTAMFSSALLAVSLASLVLQLLPAQPECTIEQPEALYLDGEQYDFVDLVWGHIRGHW